ncbi:MAG: C2 family cysteine protease [Gemmataceae bacterium]
MARNTRKASSRLFALESLETRNLLSATLLDGVVTIDGGSGNDVAYVGSRVINGVNTLEVKLNGEVTTYDPSQVQQIRFNGYAGSDTFTAAQNLTISVVAYGGMGRDTLIGGAGSDYLYGEGGNDIIRGRGSDDWIQGDAGDDNLSGGDGRDWIYGAAGRDTLFGNGAKDYLFGGAGADKVYGGLGNDLLVSIDGFSNDQLFGELGRDTFWFDRNGANRDQVLDGTASENTNKHAVASFANGADRTLDGDDIADPTDGTHYKNFYSHYLFDYYGATVNDVDQNQLGDCWLQAAMGAMVKASPNSIEQVVGDMGDGTYAVKLGGKYYRVDSDLPTKSENSQDLVYGGLGSGGTLWAAMIEKAYAFYRDGSNTYASLNGGLIKDALAAMGAKDTGLKLFSTYANATAMLQDIQAKLNAGLAVGAGGINQVPSGTPLVTNHAYTVISVNFESGVPVSITLRNPWAKDGGGSTDGNDDGYVTVTGAQLFATTGGKVQWGKPIR